MISSLLIRDLPDRSRLAELFLFGTLLGLVGLQSLVLSGAEPWFEFVVGIEFLAILALMLVSATFAEGSTIHPYSFFLGTIGLFIGGRFFGKLLGIEAALFADSAFSPISLTPAEAARLMALVMAGVLGIHIGYLAVLEAARSGWIRYPADRPRSSLVIPCAVLLGVSTLLAGVGILHAFAQCQQHGYLGLYLSQTGSYALKALPLGQYGLLLACGLAYATPSRVLHLISIVVVGCFFAAYLALGVRGGFLGFALMVLWLFHARVRRLNLPSLALILVPLFVIAQASLLVSCRNMSGDGLTLAERPKSPRSPMRHFDMSGLAWFLFSQGTTLVYTGVALRLDHYPADAYLQTFIPGYGAIAAAVQRAPKLTDLYFSHHLSYVTSPEAYARGYGMGWSLFADFHALSFGYWQVYVVLSVIFGALLGGLIRASHGSAFFLGALVCIFTRLMLLPRSGLYSIIPYVLVYACLFLACHLAVSAIRKGLQRPL